MLCHGRVEHAECQRNTLCAQLRQSEQERAAAVELAGELTKELEAATENLGGCVESGRVCSVAPQEMAHSAAAEEREGQLQEIEAVKRVCEDLRAKLRESERTVHELKAARQPEVEERRQLAESLKALEVKNSADIARHNALKEQLTPC